MGTDGPAKDALTAILQGAFSGELAAAHAYLGHARSVRDAAERRAIARVRAQELEHRQRVGEMLAELGAKPSLAREILMTVIGRTISLLCRAGGWFIPMYGAGRLERSNIVEYEHAARFAREAGVGRFVDDQLTMAEVEWDHELYFREKAATSRLWRVFPRWSTPPPRGEIRANFLAEQRRSAV